MSDCMSEVAPTRRRGWVTGWLGLSVGLLLAGAAGCGESGTVAVSSATRARISADADEDGKIALPKTKNPRKKAAGLKTLRAVKEQRAQVVTP